MRATPDTTETRRRPKSGRRGRSLTVAVSLLLHAGALGAALLWFSRPPAVVAPRNVLHAAAVSFFEPEDALNLAELELLPESLPTELDLEWPTDELPPPTRSDVCDLPEIDFEAGSIHSSAPASAFEIPLSALAQRPPRPAAAAMPTTEVSPRAPTWKPRPVRPVRRSAPRGPRRTAKGPALKLVHRPRIMNYYPAEARRRGIEGEVIIEIRVDSAGTVVHARVFRSSGSGLLDRQAVRLLYDYRFAPGAGGRARVPVSFRLR